MMYQDLKKHIPQQKYFEFEYLSMMLNMLPLGSLWGATLHKLSDYLYQNLITTLGDHQDNLHNNVYEVWDGQPSDGNTSSSLFGVVLSACATELERLDAACIDLFRQQVPGTATDMLEDWERVLGLPETCTSVTPTFEERQATAHAKLYSDYNTGLNKQFYIDYAATMGFEIEIHDDTDLSKPFYVAPVGVDPLNIGSRVGDRLNDAYQIGVIIFTIISGPSDSTQLKCAIDTLKPSHITIIWE